MARKAKMSNPTSLLLWASACCAAATVLAAAVANAGSDHALRGLSSSSSIISSCSESHPCKFKMITDLDSGSKKGGDTFKAYLFPGELYQEKDGDYKVKMDKEESIENRYSNGGKGMELSELIHFNGMLLSFCDKSGVIYEISDGEAWPREIIAKGDGEDDGGQKIEWATRKDGKLYIGSHGESDSQKWVVSIDKEGGKKFEDWKKIYDRLEDELSADEVNHEAALWSDKLKKWIFCPRRVKKKGKDASDQKMVICDEGCSKADVLDLGKRDSGVGFAAIRFVPGTDDKVIFAIKSWESGSSQKSYVTVFTIDGKILMKDYKVSSSHKYEGLAFDDSEEDAGGGSDDHHQAEEPKTEEHKTEEQKTESKKTEEKTEDKKSDDKADDDHDDHGPTSDCSESKPCDFKMVADLDKNSKSSSTKWKSYIKKGKVYQEKDGDYKVKTGSDDTLDGELNEGGRGMELSELVNFDGHLIALEDKTGVVYEIDKDKAYAREIFTEGDGDEDEGMKLEWATVKDDKLYMGSHGDSESRRFVVTLDSKGAKDRKDWKSMYDKILKACDATEIHHEAVEWSSTLKKWVFLPRTISKKDGKASHYKLVLCDEDCHNIEVKDVGNYQSGHGFSAFRFLPGTGDKVLLALKSWEDGSKQKTYATVLSIDGKVLMKDYQVSSSKKYEGLALDK